MSKTKLKIHNDGKEKYESFEARIYDSSDNKILEAYGADKDEAILNLRIKIDNLIEEVKKLKDIDFDNFDWVSLDGKLIEK
jgi:hypothetical protein